jgi:hypothetical protein
VRFAAAVALLTTVAVFATSWWWPIHGQIAVDDRTTVGLASSRGHVTLIHATRREPASQTGRLTVLRSEPWWAWLWASHDTIDMPPAWHGGGAIGVYAMPYWFVPLAAAWILWRTRRRTPGANDIV